MSGAKIVHGWPQDIWVFPLPANNLSGHMCGDREENEYC